MIIAADCTSSCHTLDIQSVYTIHVHVYMYVQLSLVHNMTAIMTQGLQLLWTAKNTRNIVATVAFINLILPATCRLHRFFNFYEL